MTKKSTIVSVVIPVYNADKSLLKAVESVLTQTYESIELVIIDDGSTRQSTQQLLISIDNYNDSRVKIIHQLNAGVSEARNHGIKESTGKYLTFLDSDDWLDSIFIEDTVVMMEDYHLDLVCGAVKEHNSTRVEKLGLVTESRVAQTEKEVGKLYDSLYLWSSWAKLYRKDILTNNDLRFPKGMQLGEDFYFVHQFLMYSERIGYVTTSIYHFENINDESLSKSYVSGLEDSLEQQYRFWKKFTATKPVITKAYYKNRMSYGSYLTALYVGNFYKKGCQVGYREKRTMVSQFINKHRNWLQIADKEQLPKTKKDKIITTVMGTRIPDFILILFATKEFLRRVKFLVGSSKKRSTMR